MDIRNDQELFPNLSQNQGFIKAEEKNIKNRCNCVESIFMLNIYPLMEQAQTETIEVDMIEQLDTSLLSANLHQMFLNQLNAKSGQGQLNLLQELFSFFSKPLLKVLIIQIFLTLGQLLLPVLIKFSISYIMKVEKDQNEGILLIVIILIVRIQNILTQSHSRVIIRKIGYEAMTVVSMLIMKKSLNISLLSNTEKTIGEITNLMQVDAQKLVLATNDLLCFAMIPLYLCISLYLMYNLIGISFIVGFTIIIITILFNIKNGEKVIKAQSQLLKDKDQRTKLINEIFTQIKFIKINALEREINIIISLKERLFCSAIIIFSGWLAPQLILSFTFGVYILLGNQMDPAKVFAIISLFQILQVAIQQLPISINALIETKLSLNRIEKFLQTQELMSQCISLMEYRDPSSAVKIINGSFYWKYQLIKNLNTSQNNELILKNINLTIKPGQFVSIVGDVGSGKSSFLQALLGEMLFSIDEQPEIKLNGQIAYVSQKAWIQNTTVRNNILFGKPLHQSLYDKAIYYSCLTQDLTILSNGDQTMIGEKGINLSGGQKARVSLARAIYSGADILLLDDPLSAVDAHVGNFIMKECFLGYLKETTRVLITHALNYCQFTNYIYLFENGEIVESGRYENIKENVKFKEISNKFNLVQAIDDDDIVICRSEDNNTQQIQQHSRISSNKEITIKQYDQKDEIDDLMLIEERQKGEISQTVFNSFFSYNGGLKSFGLVCFIMVMWIGCYLCSSLWIARWTVKQQNINDFSDRTYFFIYLTLGCSQAFFAFFRALAIIKQSVKSSCQIHNEMMGCLIYAPQCQFFERVPLGRILNRFTKDINSLDTEIYMNISWLYTKMSQLLSHTFLNIYASTYLIVFPIILFFFICLKIQRLYMKASRELIRLELISKSPILSYFTQTLTGLTTIRAYQQVDKFLMHFADKLDTNRRIIYAQVTANAWFIQILGLTSLIVNMTAIVYCILYADNPAFAGLVMTYAANIDMNILQTVESLSALENDIISFERCLAFTKVQQEKRNENSKIIKNWPTEGKVELIDFSVSYRTNLPPALRNVSVQISQNEKIGIVGRTGAGKSTITLSVLRILEAINGKIVIDNVDISTLSLNQLRESVTTILQDAAIFTGTIRENLDPLRKCTDEEISEILSDCCLNRLINDRNGLKTKINEGGDNLSSGEKQLICIARAILKKSKIILIDEATANIDIDTEHKIQSTIIKAFKNCTVITIAHRINTILHCDKILVVDGGTIKEYGYTTDLLNNKQSSFYQIYLEALKNHQN